MTPYSLSFEFDELPKLPNALMMKHWRTKSNEAKKWKTLVRILVGRKRPAAPLEKAELTLTRYSSVRPDFDGLVGSFKPVIDGLKVAGVIVDDKHDVIGDPTYKWEKCAPKKGKIKVEVKAAA